MAGVTDRAFRLVCAEHGAQFCVSEMVSAKAVAFGSKKTAELARIGTDEAPCALQIFGHEPQVLAQSAQALLDFAANDPGAKMPIAVDINMGCPVHKVVTGGDGSTLMRNPALVGEIVRTVSEHLSLPVTVKIRTGWDEHSKNAVQVASAAEQNGVHAVTVHGRTRTQMYAPGIDYESIAAVKRAVSVPVIGNGGIFNAEDAVRMLESTGCDALMIARGALGNPFIFEEVAATLAGKRYDRPDARTVLAVARRHLALLSSEKGNHAAAEFRKHAGWYTKGMRGSSAVRERLCRAQTVEETEELLFTLEKEN